MWVATLMYTVYALVGYLGYVVIVHPLYVWAFSPFNAFPGPKPYPFIGTMYAIKFTTTTTEPERMVNGVRRTLATSNVLSLISTYVAEYKRMYAIHAGPSPRLVLCHPETMAPVIRSSSALSKGPAYSMVHPWLGSGLLLASNPKWEPRRKALTPAFHFHILSNAHANVAANTKILIQKLADEAGKTSQSVPYVDIVPFVTAATLDIICEAAMNVRINAQNGGDNGYLEDVGAASSLILRRILTPWYAPWFLNGWLFEVSALGRETRAVLGRLHEFTGRIIRQRREERSAENNSGRARNGGGEHHQEVFLDLLMGMRDEEGNPLDDQDIQNEVDTFVFEGHDTTSASISWALYLLGSHPEVADAIYEEIREKSPSFARHAAGEGDGTAWVPEESELSSFPTLLKLLDESHRLYPPVPFVSRIVDADASLSVDGYEIPGNTQLSLNIFALHRNPELWDNPHEFDLSRWDERRESPFAFIPFSAGKRNCIGRKFAEREVRSVVAAVIAAFEVEGDEEWDVVPQPDLVLRPGAGVPLKLRPRPR